MLKTPDMIHISKLKTPELTIETWDVEAGASWCVVGRNGAGKQHIDALLLGNLPGVTAANRRIACDPDKIRLVSFETQQAVYEHELRLAANDMLNESESGTRVADFLPADMLDNELIDSLGLRERLSHLYIDLSTGESRKLLVLKALFEGAELLVLDNPFDSLDIDALASLSATLAAVNIRGVTVVFLLSNQQDIPDWCQYGAAVEGGALRVLGALDSDAVQKEIAGVLAGRGDVQPEWPASAVTLDDYPHETLVSLDNCNVSYGGKPILVGIDLTVSPLGHTLITGENGAGKSTLLGLVTGDCPQCFSNDVTVLGHRRGTGESVWDIKSQMGIVSADLHRRYRVRCDTLTVVLSGFFDSIGVYDPVSEEQRRMAAQWLAAAGLCGRGGEGFHNLSYGEQRLALIARALVKSPLLLILDEPTQGLDQANRLRLINLLEVLDQRRHSTVIFVSHRRDEYLPMFGQHIHLKKPDPI